MNILEYAILTEKNKDIKCTEEERTILVQKLNEALNKKYHAVCLNIGGMLDTEDNLSEEMLKSIYSILKKNVPIVLITGRGEGGLKLFVNTLIEQLKERYNVSSSLLKDIIGISNNGNFLFYTSGKDKEKYLDFFYNLTDEHSLNLLSNFRDELLIEKNDITSNNYITYSYCKSLNDVLTNIRIIVTNEEKLEQIEEYISKKISNNETYNKILKYDIGKFRGNTVLQIGISTKGKAVEEIERFLGIPKNSILRIGSNGQYDGADYEMLKSLQGFSTDRYSQDIDGCFPVFDDEGKLLKGISAIQFLLKKLKFFPTVCLEKPNREKYIKQLAVAEKKIYMGRSKIINDFNRIFIENFAVNDGFNDVFDKKSGGIIFKDWEWELLSDNNRLKKLFETNDSGKYKYMIDTDSGKMLRGADTYYYFLANKGKKQNVIPRQIFEWWQNNSTFIRDVLYILGEYKINTPEDKRLLLGVLDNVKNISLIMLNARIVSKFPNENILLSFDTYLKEKDIMNWYNICSDVYSEMGNLCFSDKPFDYQIEDIAKTLSRFAEEYKNEVLDILRKNDDGLNKKCFRSYREIDNYIENYITMSLVITKGLEENPRSFNKGVNFTGIAYGGLELPFLAKNILQGDAYTSVVLLKGKYKDRHMQNIDYDPKSDKLNILGNVEYGDGANILTDDNVLTGKTLQIALDILFSNGLNVDNTAIVRYPSINRVEQMFFEGHGAIDTTKFFTFIKGLIFPSPYSKIKSTNNESYLDELGIFNKSRDRIVRYLYKNGRFSTESEVGQINSTEERQL